VHSVNFLYKMVQNISRILNEYEVRVQSSQSVPMFSQGRQLLGPDNGPNRPFLCSLFNDHLMAMEFLKGIGLLRKTMRCRSCDVDMTCLYVPILVTVSLGDVLRK
jgi:hypothetical protein